jgi:hypothetical protein
MRVQGVIGQSRVAEAIEMEDIEARLSELERAAEATKQTRK